MSISETNQFYVYVYLDPRKPGKYKYGEYEFDYEPFYVGKGKGRRIKNHFKPSVLNDKTIKSNKFKSIINEGFLPIGFKIFQNLTDEQSKQKEIELIKNIGRIKSETGPLTNLTDGGDGSVGFKHTDESRSKINKRYYPNGKNHPLFGKSQNEIFKGKSGSMKGKHHLDESKEKIRNASLGRKHSDETKQKCREINLGLNNPNSKYVYIINEKIFNSLSELCKVYNFNLNGVNSAIQLYKGKYKGWQIEKKML